MNNKYQIETSLDSYQCFYRLNELYNKIPEDARRICWIAGGCFRSYIEDKEPKDLDIFSNDPHYIVNVFENSELFKKGYDGPSVTNFYLKDGKAPIFQVVKRHNFRTQEATLNNFDFTIVQASYGLDGFCYHPRFFADNAQKRLVISNIIKPHSSIKRAFKYTSRNYKLCPIGLAQLLKAVQENPIDFDNPDENEIEFYPDGTATFVGID